MELGDLEGRRLKKSEVEELLADRRWAKDERLTEFFGQGGVFIHPEKNAVLSVDWNRKGGMLFSDKEAVYRVFSDPGATKPKHMLQGIFNYGQDFPARAKLLAQTFIENISSKLSKPIDTTSVDSLLILDKYVAVITPKKLLQSDLFPGLIAYIGEVVKKNYSMEWVMIQVEEDVWEPWLVDDAGNRYPIFAPVYKELYEYRKGSSSLYGVVVGEIQRENLQGPT